MAQLEKIMSIYYGSNKLPYKDEDRQTHYPIAGETNTFVGENNTTKVRFFVDRIGGSNYTWVAKVKKPNGTICYRVLEMDNDDYVDVDLSFLYTDQVGQIDLALNGYTTRDITITENDGDYEISGNPTVICTGIIKIIINYAPLILNMGATVQPGEYQQILAMLSTKLSYGVESEKVNELPTTGKANTIYYVKSNESDIVYDIYYWNGTTFAYLGTTAYDLYTKDEGTTFENYLKGYVITQLGILENEISQVVDGSPKGVYATLTDLQSAYPTGASGIYVVSANGHWYYWSGSAWTDGGTYLSSLYQAGEGIDISSNQTISINATTENVLNRVSTKEKKKTHLIYSWCENLGYHFTAILLGHCTAYNGYTTCEYFLVNIGDELALTMQTGVSEIQVHEYSVDDNGKIVNYLGKNTYSSNTTIKFAEKRIIRISVKGSTTPTFATAQQCAKIISYRDDKDIFVTPYGAWEYCANYYYAGQNPDSVLDALNGDPYYDTCAKKFANGVWKAYGNARLMFVNLNYSYTHYGIQKPSILRTLYYSKNNNASVKMTMLADNGSVTGFSSSFSNMSNTDFNKLEALKYNGDIDNPFAINQNGILLIEFQSQSGESTSFLSTQLDGDTLFNSIQYKIGFVYNGEKVDLKKHIRKNELKNTYKGLFPFVSTQGGGQKPSSMSEYNGKLFVGCDNYGCNIINLSDLTLVASISDNQLGHFNNCEFTNEKYSSDDTYPLLMVGNGDNAYNLDLGSQWGDYIKLIRFANDLSSFSVARKYVLPTAIAGFYTNAIGVDNDNRTLWVMGYYNQDWSSGNGNKSILTSWDLSNCTIDNDGNYVPALKTRCEFPWIRAYQDMTFVNGYIFMLAESSVNGTMPSQLYIIDTIKQTIRRTEINLITPFAEIEAITKIYDEELDKYYLLVGEALYNSYGGVNGTYGHIYRLDTID